MSTSLPPDNPNAKPVSADAVSAPELEPSEPTVASAHASAPEAPLDAGLEALWGRVTEQWDDNKRHGALLEYASAKNQLAEAAGLYRALRDDPDKGEIAKKKLEAIVMLATSMLAATATPRRERRTHPVITALAMVVSFGLMLWLARAMWGRR